MVTRTKERTRREKGKHGESSEKFPCRHHPERTRRRWCECVVQRKRCLSSTFYTPKAKQKQERRQSKRKNKISMKMCASKEKILFHTSSSFFSSLRWCISMFVDALHKLFGVFFRAVMLRTRMRGRRLGGFVGLRLVFPAVIRQSI